MPYKTLITCQRSLALVGTSLCCFTLLQQAPLTWEYSLAAALLLTYFLWLGWQKQLRHLLRAKKFSPVFPGRLYRSGQLSRFQSYRILKKYGIRTVIDLTARLDTADCHQQAEQSAIRKLDINGLRFPMHGDGTGPLETVTDAVAALHYAVLKGEPVLLHCAAGVQRTGHVLSAYLLLVDGIPPQQVYHFMSRFGWQPGATGWPQQLNQRMPKLAELLWARGILDSIPASIPQLPLENPGSNAGWWRAPAQLLVAVQTP